MKAPSIPRRTWLIASTVAVIGGFFAYYFFVYMEASRVELEAKKFRALAQYADNIRGAYGERTKKLLLRYSSGNCSPSAKKKALDCDSVKELRQARRDVIRSVIAQSDFSELVFMVDRTIESQSFRNTIDENIVNDIFSIEDAGTKRRVEFTVNDKDYVIFIQSFKLADKPWKIFGFCAKNEFESQVRAVDLKYIVVASLTLILVILMMPLLKLLIMNESEKLHVINVWFCGFSLLAGSSFLVLMVLMASDFSAKFNSHDKDDQPDSLTREYRISTLSRQVEKNLKIELRMIYDQIQESKLGGYPKAEPCDSLSLYSEVLKNVQFKSYPFFNEMLWIKKNGWQDTLMATHKSDCAQHVNLTTRKYFSQAVYNDSTWSMPDSDSGTERFALQSIRSYLTDQREAGFGVKRHKSDTTRGVIAIATKLHSVMDPLLPPGYQFVLVDAKGKVWFHSKTEKNLNENLIDETGDDQTLVAAINGRSEVMITVTYGHSNHRALVRPIRNTGLTLIVLHDDDFFNTPIVLTVGFAFLLLSFLFLILGLHQLILLASTYSFSLLKVKRFFLAWLRPEKEKRRIYRRAVWVQVFLLIPTACLAAFTNSSDVVIFFFVLPIYLTVYHYFSLEYKRIAEEKENPNIKTWMHPFFIASVLLIVSVNYVVIYLFEVEKFGLLISAQILVILILLFFYSWIVLQRLTSPILSMMWSATNSILALTTRIFRALRLQPLSSRYDRSYCNFLFLWLILTSVIPTYYIYKLSYAEETKIWMRYLQLTAARNEEARDAKLNNEFREIFNDRVDWISNFGNFLTVTNEINTTKSNSHQFDKATCKPIHEIVFNDVPLTGIAEETRAAIFPAAGDLMWVSRESDHSSEMEYFTSQREKRFYRSELPKHKTFKGDYGAFFLIMFVLGGVLVYRTLRFCVTHIFGLGLLGDNRYKTPQLLRGARYFIVGLPHSGKSRLVKMIQRREKIENGNVETVNLNDDSPIQINGHCELIVATGFHRELNNHKSNQDRLERLSSLLQHRDKPVIVISNSDPSAVLEFYEKLADYYRNEKGDAELEGKFRECRQAYNSWSNVLTSFSIHYHKLRECNPFDERDINAELDHGDFLPRLYHQLKKPVTNMRDREKMVLQVEDLSQTYYRAIWNCLSTSEKFLLHDLAKDRFVNMRNMKTIRALRQKGLMVGGNSLQIMNRSFNNFILSIVEEDTDVKMEQQIRQKGSWNTVHLILVIAIISIIVFLGLAQQELFKNFQAILAATAALLPLLARFGGIFTGSKSKE